MKLKIVLICILVLFVISVDLTTGLMWTKQYYGKLSFDEGPEYAKTLRAGGYDD